MIFPDINDLMDKVDSRYTLVVATAKRARQLVDGAGKMTKFNSDKAVTLAIHEIAEGKVSYTREPTEAHHNYDTTPSAVKRNSIGEFAGENTDKRFSDETDDIDEHAFDDDDLADSGGAMLYEHDYDDDDDVEDDAEDSIDDDGVDGDDDDGDDGDDLPDEDD